MTQGDSKLTGYLFIIKDLYKMPMMNLATDMFFQFTV